MKKVDRLVLLQNLITNLEIKRQDDLVQLLKERGYPTTQATISRDIKELGYAKVSTSDGKYRYVNQDSKRNSQGLLQKFVNSIFKQDNMIRFDVLPGTTASIKNDLRIRFSQWIFVVVNDDDTLLLIAKNAADANAIYKELKQA